ncbi:hypothetical protein BDK89_4200 [Ilumatobacter fluminis]|uniref:Cellulose binding domain-containing protein n=2 Tax=Ilumatobacter fluminis TaxID=467091 RepID=A0A4R7I6S9_9ACTN|nr:hypothetical protein BDK89_4200 [Ilumatobacter fluminis]
MPDCEFEITQDQGNGQKGEGNLSVSNTGSSFTGWTVEISQANPSDLWRFYNWASGVTVVGSTSPTIEVTGSDTIGATVNYSVKLDQADQGAISAGDTLSCAVLSIGP